MTEKEIRKHIIPFLRYSVTELENRQKNGDYICLCYTARDYTDLLDLSQGEKDSILKYLRKRLRAARPKGSGRRPAWWRTKTYDTLTAFQMAQKRIDFCKQQLKIVKP